jgi:hypothetical protein
VDAPTRAWYNLTAVKSTATPARKSDRALGATLGRGTFTAYYWRFI